MVRQRGGKAGPSRMKLCRKDSMEGEGESAATIWLLPPVNITC